MWCTVKSATASSGPRRRSAPRSSGPAARSKGAAASSRASSRARASRSASGRPDRSTRRKAKPAPAPAPSARRRRRRRGGTRCAASRAAAPPPPALPLQGGHVQRAAQPQRHGEVVGGVARVQLLDEPQALLRERQRQRPRPAARAPAAAPAGPVPRGAAPPRAPPSPPPWAPRRARGCGTSTSSARRTRDTTRVASSECPPSRKKSSATPTRSTPSTSAQIAASARSVGVRGAAKPPSSAPRPGRGEGPAVHLAVGGEGERVHGDHEGGGDHVLRQPLPQVVAQRGGRRVRPRLRDHVRHQPPSPGRSSRTSTSASRTAGCSSRRAATSRGLHAEAADLDLVVGAAQELQVAVRQPARPVAGAVQARPRRPPERVGDEPAPPSAPGGPGSRAPRPAPPTNSSPGTPGEDGCIRLSST